MRFFIIVLLVLCAKISAAEVQPLAIGAQAPDFKLKGIDGKTYTLKSFKSDVLVVIFSANHCPTAQAYEERIMRLVESYPAVSVVMISPNAPNAVALEELGYTDLGDSFEEMKIRARQKNFNFPYLYDGDQQSAAKAYGPQATPHLFIFDKARKLRYQGRFDDTENPYETPRSHDAVNAVEALLAGKSVPVEQTKVFGCSIKWAEKAAWVARLDAEWAALPVEVQSVDLAGVRELIKNDSDKLVLLNVWATWCGPCVVEFPDLVKIHRMYKNRRFELVTLSADKPNQRAQVLKFLQERNAAVRNLHADTDDIYALIEVVDPQWGGAIPHTLLIAPGGEVLYRHTGLIEPLEVKQAIIRQIGRYFADDK